MDVSAASQLQISPARLARLILALLVASALLLPLAQPARAADIQLEAQALLAGNVRPGSWAAVRVQLRNDGPSLTGELRIRSSQQGRSQYGTEVELPSGARQEHILYSQPPTFGSRLHVDLVSGEQTIATAEVRIKSHDAWSPIIAVVAERPEGIQAGIADVARNPQGQSANVVVLNPSDLPPRVEAWSAIDRLVWQDVDAAQLDTEQLEALRLWVGAGGRLVVVAGTTGTGPVRAFPEDLLPYQPAQTIQVNPDDLTHFLGTPPADATFVPALSGTLREGSVLARGSAGEVIAAQLNLGQGSVTVLGINPAERWIAESNSSRVLWRRMLPLGSGAFINPLNLAEDSQLLAALFNLPAVDLPPIDQLFLLLFAYVALIGPINYLVLRRLDRREWAWFTMPLLVAIFTVVSYGMGATLKGSDVIVNQVAIVRAGEGTGQGLGQVYIGVFSPTRRTFDVQVPGGALLSNASNSFQFGQAEQPLDILFGEPSRLRNFEVGFGVLRGFRAEAPTAAPVIDSELRLVLGKLEGTVTNRSPEALEQVAIVFGNSVLLLNDLAGEETREVSLDTSTGSSSWYQLSERILGSSFRRDRAEARVGYTRRVVIDQLTGWGPRLMGAAADRPVLLGWRREPVLEVELSGELPNRVGDSLYMVPLSMTLDREAVLTNQMMSKSVLENSGEGWADIDGFYLGRGTMVVEIRPTSLDGGFRVDGLELALTQGDFLNQRGTGTQLEPLPPDEQPDQDDPLGDPPEPLREPRWEEMPELQLFDLSTQLWVEFPRLNSGRNYLVAEPERYVDENGRLLVRMVNRGAIHDQKWFSMSVRLTGIIE